MTAQEVQRILRRVGVRPQQAAGQNFLLDENVTAAMVDVSGIGKDDTVLEIGPGLGILTEAILSTGAHVIAVELDRRLCVYLQKKFHERKNFQLIENDIFRVRLDQHFEDQQYALVANLPYSSTSLILRNFLSLSPRPRSLTVMIQRDVARRITAQPGNMSVLSLMVQHYSRPSIVFDVPPASFYPMPKVTSSVLYCDKLQPLGPDDERYFRIIRAGFSSKRKKLTNSLSGSLKISQKTIENALHSLNRPETARAQELNEEDWLKLAQLLG